MNTTSHKHPPIIVTGMGRSGTSLVGRYLAHCGVNLGSQLVAADAGNEDGYFENAEIVQFHQSIMARDSTKPDRKSYLDLVSDADRNKARAILQHRPNDARWGWKDPRTSLFLDLLTDLLPAMQCIFMLRHPFEVLISVRRLVVAGKGHWRSNTRWLESWQTRTMNCVAFAKKYPQNAIWLDYARFLQYPGTAAEALGHFLELDCPPDALVDMVHAPKTDTGFLRNFPLRALPSVALKCAWTYHRLRQHAVPAENKLPRGDS